MAVPAWVAVALWLGTCLSLEPTALQHQIPSLPDYVSTYTKMPEVLQFGDVTNAFGDNERFLNQQTGAFTAPEVGDAGLEDWGIVNPKDEENHQAVKSGDLVAFRSPSRGEFLTFAKLADNAPFGFSKEANREALFRLVLQADCKNPEKSTSAAEYHPSGKPLRYGDTVMVFPQSAKDSGNVGKFSIYPQVSGNLFLTDSVVMGWRLDLADHNSCDKNEETTGSTCCSWKHVSATNQGVSESEKRVCCKRTGHHLCHSTEERVRQCAPGFAADQTVTSRRTVMETNDAAQKALKKAEATASSARQQADELNNKAAGLRMDLQAQKSGGASESAQQSVEVSIKQTEALADKANEAALSADNLYKEAKETASRAEQEWAAKATGGQCCAWVRTSSEDVNPAVSTHRCCSSEGCLDQGRRLAHKECNLFGELVDGHCVCDSGHGGLSCLVEASTACFQGTRKNGVTPTQRTGCKKCYKCERGGAVRLNGEVVVSGDDLCLPEGGPETLCLSCPASAGLLRLGDAPGEIDSWKDGYKDRGICLRFPRISVDQKQEECASNCLPRLDSDFAASNALGCSSVCSMWNQVKVDLQRKHLDLRALCHVTKDAQCHSLNNPMGAALATNISDPDARKCSAVKSTRLASVCYVLENDGTKRHANGYGSRCADGSVPLSKLAQWQKTERTVVAQDYKHHMLSLQDCQAACLAEHGCPKGFSHRRQHECRIPSHSLLHEAHLAADAEWSHYRWTGVAYSLEDPQKWCCWVVSDGFKPPDWLQNVPEQQYCGTVALQT